MSRPPRTWVRICVELFGTSERFAQQLWARLYPSQTLQFQLGLCNPHLCTRDQWVARLRHLADDLLPPQELIATALRIAPDRTGKPRPREAIAFEESVLAATDSQGRWDWSTED